MQLFILQFFCTPLYVSRTQEINLYDVIKCEDLLALFVNTVYCKISHDGFNFLKLIYKSELRKQSFHVTWRKLRITRFRHRKCSLELLFVIRGVSMKITLRERRIQSTEKQNTQHTVRGWYIVRRFPLLGT